MSLTIAENYDSTSPIVKYSDLLVDLSVKKSTGQLRLYLKNNYQNLQLYLILITVY